jgi:hypothetical protein
MKTRLTVLAVVTLLGSGHLAEAFPYARAAMAARTVRANVSSGFGYGYGIGVGYNEAYDNSYLYGTTTTTTTPTPSYTKSGTLTKLPADAAPVVVFGKTYYFSGGVYYLPQTSGGRTVYVVANP